MSQTHIDPIMPSAEDATMAQAAKRALERNDASGQALHLQISAAGQEATAVDLPPVVTRLLMGLLNETAAGRAVSVVSVDAEVTTQQAAEILNVSRPYLVGMIEKGILPARMVGNQRRLPLHEVLAYKADNRARRRETLREMTALDQDLGLL